MNRYQTGRFYLSQVIVYRSGYTADGIYFGSRIGKIYKYIVPEYATAHYIEAASRENAKAIVCDEYPNAVFFW